MKVSQLQISEIFLTRKETKMWSSRARNQMAYDDATDTMLNSAVNIIISMICGVNLNWSLL